MEAARVLALVLVAVASVVDLGGAQPVVRSVSVHQQHADDVQLLGQTENCKSVVIPAMAVCGPGLECSAASGTCVPVRQRPSQYQDRPEKMFGYSKLSLQSKTRPSFNSVPLTADKPLKPAWTLSWNKGAIRHRQ